MKIVLLFFFVLLAKVGVSQTVDSLPNKTYNYSEAEAEFPGGDSAWTAYLSANINSDVPQNNNAKKGKYKVDVEFSIGIDSVVSIVKAYTHYGYGMEDEVIRVIKNSPKWIPGVLHGQPVIAYRRQRIKFVVE